MKAYFASTLVAVFASAQESEGCPYVTKNEETGLLDIEGLFHTWSIKDVDDQAVIDWATNKEAEYEAVDQMWVDAMEGLINEVATPWNDFVARAEEIANTARALDVSTTEEVVRFVTENTYIEGQSLSELYPKIDELLLAMQEESASLEERFNLDAIEATPVSLWKSEYPGENIGAAFVSWGFDPVIVNSWLSDTSASWEQLQHEQQIAEAQLAMGQVQEAASYAEGILDNMMADLVAANEGHMAAIEEAANAKVEELKLEIEEKAHADIAELEAFVEVALAELKAATAAGIEMLGESIEETLESIDEAAEELDEMESSQSESDIEVEDAEDATVSLLAAEVEVAAEPKIPSSSYVYAGMGLAGVATAAYFMMKKQK